MAKKKAKTKGSGRKKGSGTTKGSAKRKDGVARIEGSVGTDEPLELGSFAVVASLTEDRESAADGLGSTNDFGFVMASQDDGEGGELEGRPRVRDSLLLPEIKTPGHGDLELEGIVGDRDERKRVFDTREYPYRAICSVVMRRDGYRDPGVGTGWLAGPRLILTAGHNLCHNNNLGGRGWIDRVEVYFARNGHTEYWKKVEIRDRGRMGVSDEWLQSKDTNLDYGVIILDEPLGDKTGWFGLAPWSKTELLANEFNVVGYPASRSSDRKAKSTDPYTMWGDRGRITWVGDHTLQYSIDTTGGQSGAPLFAKRDDGKMLCVGVHNYDMASANQATRITPALISNLESLL